MSFTAQLVMDKSAALLNDAALTLYTYTIQLPYLKLVLGELEKKLILEGVKAQLKKSALIAVAANATSITLPADFFLPISIVERPSDSTSHNDWIPMVEKRILRDRVASSTLGEWAFNNGLINVIGATVARSAKIDYWSYLSTKETTVQGTTISSVDGVEQWMAYRNASLMAKYIGGEPAAMRAADLQNDADVEWDNFSSIITRNNQGIRTRRRPFRAPVSSK
jgi:hypothetical protein